MGGYAALSRLQASILGCTVQLATSQIADVDHPLIQVSAEFWFSLNTPRGVFRRPKDLCHCAEIWHGNRTSPIP